MFALDGKQLLCANKCTLLRVLEAPIAATGTVGEDIADFNNSSMEDIAKKLSVVILDGMAQVQAMKKPHSVKT